MNCIFPYSLLCCSYWAEDQGFRHLGLTEVYATNMKKDILFLCQYFYPEHNSSATLPFDTAKSFVRQGYPVGVLCGYPKEYFDGNEVPYDEDIDGIHIHRI